jgi:recombination protein RecA
MTSSKDILAVMKKDYGEKSGGLGSDPVTDLERIQTGCFEFDLATGGGFPKGCTSIVYGPESSGKTNLCLRAVALHQQQWPGMTCVWMAVEPFDPPWAKKMGVDLDKLVLMKPDYAEQCVDMAEAFMGADDCGLVVIDSIAAMAGQTTLQKSAEEGVMGGTGSIINRFCDKVAHEIRLADKQGRSLPTMVFVNQLRMKVGVVFGNPMTIPGGAKQKFLSQMTIRVSGKNIMDNKVSKVLPVAKEMQFVVEKWKVPIISVNGKFEMVMVAHNGLQVGECADWNTVAGLLKGLGLLTKADKSGWKMYDDMHPTLTAAKDHYYTNKLFGLGVRKALIEAALEGGTITVAENEEETE